MNKLFPALLILSSLAFPALGQEPDTVSSTLDSIYQSLDQEILEGDSLSADNLRANSIAADSLLSEYDYTHSPLKATMYALVLPGLGQAYNKKYWKMPIVWGGMGAMVYFISYNTKNYQEAVIEYLEDSSVEYKVKGWRRNMELSYIGLFVVYSLQVLDAYVDANMYNWNVNNMLSIGVSPSLQPMMHPASLTGQAVGLSCNLTIRGR